jgi:phosphoglycerate dehydrogenase-like enzyme
MNAPVIACWSRIPRSSIGSARASRDGSISRSEAADAAGTAPPDRRDDAMSDSNPARPTRVLLSHAGREALAAGVAEAFGNAPYVLVEPGDDADLAFLSRDVTGLSTKHDVLPETQRFYDALRNAPSLRWVHAHSAGADRPIYPELMKRGVTVTTSSGANAGIVVQTALAGILALTRRFPRLFEAQRDRQWKSLANPPLPRDLAGQTALIVGWGPIGQGLASLLSQLGMRIAAVRSSAANAAPASQTVAFEDIGMLLGGADWLVLACPLTDRTRGLIDAEALARLPRGAHFVNVARGEIVDEDALIAALQSGHLAGAHLDVFAHEPLPPESPLWRLPNVIVTPHSAGHSAGNEQRAGQIFLANLACWRNGEALRNVVDPAG